MADANACIARGSERLGEADQFASIMGATGGLTSKRHLWHCKAALAVNSAAVYWWAW